MPDQTVLSALRATIRGLERPSLMPEAVVPLGWPEVDAALPGGGLPLGALHQITGGEDGFLAPALAFAARLAARAVADGGRRVLWGVVAGSADDALYGPGLAAWGLTAPLIVRARDETETLWCLEEALRCPAIGVGLAQVRRIDATAVRRLHLAAEQGGSLGLLLPSAHGAGWRLQDKAPALPVASRWHVAAAPGDGWHVTLERYRGALPRTWSLRHGEAGSEPPHGGCAAQPSTAPCAA